MLNNQSTSFGGLTPQRVPEAFIRAEVASIPLASEEAFRLNVTELHPLLEDTPEGEKTKHLWRICEERLSEHASGWSLDRLIAIRDFFWFDYKANSEFPNQPNHLHNYLRNLAQCHVCNRPGISEVTNNENYFESTAHYRWLIFALPEDLLLMSTSVDPPASCVDIDPPLLVRCLQDKGVSEIHQHIGASMDFKTLWMSTLAALASPELEPDSLADPEVPFKSSEVFFRWLLAAAITRSLLMEYLISGRKCIPLLDYLLELSDIRGQLRHTLEETLVALRYGNERMLPGYYPLRNLYQEIHPQGYDVWKNPPKTLDEAWCVCDPISVRLSLKSPNEGEIKFVRRSLSHLEKGRFDRNPDTMFILLFWQVVRLRNLLYRSVVQRPMTAGLQWFIRFSNRLWPLRTPLAKMRSEISYEIATGSAIGSLAALEIRCPAKTSSIALAQEICDLTYSWKNVLDKYLLQNGREPEFGIVLLLAKSRDQDERWEHGNPPAFGSETHAEPLPSNNSAIRLGGRYSSYFRDQVRKVRAAAELIHKNPSTLWILRGIDVANDELSIPTWVLVPLYAFLERESAFASANVQNATKPKPLRLTAHVGEDFRHLMEGMRRIFETVHYLLRRSGGRLGHATALGYNPQQWAENTESVMMPVEDRMWDLVFEWRLYTGFHTPFELRVEVPQGRVGYLENEIRKLSDFVFECGQEPHTMALIHHTLHSLWSGPEVNKYQSEIPLNSFDLNLINLNPEFYYNNASVGKLIDQYRKCEKVFRRGQQLVNMVINQSEVAALEAVQDALRRLVSIRGIVVEVNPSSNLLICNLLDLRNHPTLRLFPPEPDKDEPPPVRIALGSDDPITFCTYLMREYSLLYNAALSAGYSENSVAQWLEEVRHTGMYARFTTAWPNLQEKKFVDLLIEDLDNYLQRPTHYRRYMNYGIR